MSCSSLTVTAAPGQQFSIQNGTGASFNPVPVSEPSAAAAGSTVTFTYVVTNTDVVPLANVAVTDDPFGTITGPASGDANTNGLLDLTETWTYTKTTTALAGQQTNVGTVTSQYAVTGATTSDTDPANYFGDATTGVITDPCNPTKPALMVAGTSGNDTIKIDKGPNSSSLKVTINNVAVGTFAFTGNLYVFGLAGNDTITVASQITRDTFLYGDAGNDRITAGNGRNVVVGGDGNDTITTGNGRDVLIGGEGADSLSAGNGDEILVAGFTSYDLFSATNAQALCKLRDEWSRADLSYPARVNRLRGTTPGSPFVFRTAGATQNVFDDGDVDRLIGGNAATGSSAASPAAASSTLPTARTAR